MHHLQNTWRMSIYCTPLQAESFFKTHEVSTAKRAIAQVLERVEMNVDWLTKYKHQVCDWLSENWEAGPEEPEVQEPEEAEEEKAESSAEQPV